MHDLNFVTIRIEYKMQIKIKIIQRGSNKKVKCFPTAQNNCYGLIEIKLCMHVLEIWESESLT